MSSSSKVKEESLEQKLQGKLEEDNSSKTLRLTICQFDSNRVIDDSKLTKPYDDYHDNGDGKGEVSERLESEIVDRNFERVESFISRSKSSDSQLVIFPEYFLTGLIDNKLHLVLKEGKLLKKFQDLAKSYEIDLVTGTIVEETLEDNKQLLNTSYYINKFGEVVGKYHKKNLWHTEKYLTASTHDNHVFVSNGIKIGLLICWDLVWPEAFRDLMKEGVELIIVPSYWTLDGPGSIMESYNQENKIESDLIDSLTFARSIENQCFIVFVNCAGKEEEGYLGYSNVKVPLLGNLIRFDDCSEKIETFELKFDILKDVEKVYKIKRDYVLKQFY